MHSAFIPPTEYRPLTRMFLSNSDWYNPTVRRNYGFPSFNGDVLVKSEIDIKGKAIQLIRVSVP